MSTDPSASPIDSLAIDSLFEVADFFVLRSPTLPFDLLTDWAAAAPDPGTTNDQRIGLGRLIGRADVREALLLAAPAVESLIDDWAAGRLPDEEARKLERTLVRYLERMCWRSTPFGLFAGTALGIVGDATRIALGPRERRKRFTTLDTEYLSALAVALARDPKLRPALRYRPTACLHFRGDQIVFIGARRDGSGSSRPIIAPRTPELERILRAAKEGATFQQLEDELCAAPAGIVRADAERLLESLVRGDVLVDDLDLPVVGADPLDYLIDRLERTEEVRGVRRLLVQVREQLSLLDAEAQSTPASRQQYRCVAELLAPLPNPPSISRLFNVVLRHATSEAALDRRVIRQVLAGAKAQCILMPNASETLDAFRRTFVARYDRQEVPLMAALDEITGIGFDLAGSTMISTPPLLRDLEPIPGAPAERVRWGGRERWLAQKVMEAARSGSDEITVADELLSSLDSLQLPEADSFAVIGSLHARDEQAIKDGQYRFHVRRVVGPTAASMLSRFCANDLELTERVRALTAREAELASDAIIAEVVHVAHPRMGNVAWRPALRQFEIPLLGSSASAGAVRLSPDDLTVSVRGHEVRLHSRRWRKRVLPRLTYSDNAQLAGLPVYRFLASIARSEGVFSEWSWGPLMHLRELPRVVYARCILALARWRFDAAETKRLVELTHQERAAELERMRSARRLPRWVTLVDRDRGFPVDFTNPLSVEAFLHLVRGTDAVVEEMFPGPGSPLIAAPDGRHAHELIVPFLRKEPRPSSMSSRLSVVAGPRDRLRLPASDWLYAKLYCEVGAADRVLRDVVLPIVQQTEGAWSRWFFLRYGDPDWHLRLRFQGDPEALRKAVLPALNRLASSAAHARWIHRLTLDTYDPEWERYGGPATMPLVEQVFQRDSEAALALSVVYANDAQARWQLTLSGMHRLLYRFCAADDERLEIARHAAQRSAREAGLVGRASRALGRRFRDERAGLCELLETELPAQHRLRVGVDILDERDASLAPVAAELLPLFAGEEEFATKGRVIESLLHLHANRVLPSHHRLQEAFLFDFIERLLRAEKARRPKPATACGAAASDALTRGSRVH